MPYNKQRKRPLLPHVVAAQEVKFWDRVNKIPGGCWLWTGPVVLSGYGTHHYAGRKWAAHRLAYKLVHGSIPDDLDACHECDTPRCVNPDHIFLGTARDNIRDASRKGRLIRTPTLACKRGHPWTEDSTLWRRMYRIGKPYRVCRICEAAAVAKWKALHPDYFANLKRAHRAANTAGCGSNCPLRTSCVGANLTGC